MPDKITFEELVDTISEKTDQSKSFTHDFFNDLIDEIRDGLLDEEKVNIAQFGKFELHHVDKKEGYNPQTEQKMTIPAHKKAVFKPYKNLRQTVNADYADLQPQMIAPDEDEQEASFIPTAPPADIKSTEVKKAAKSEPSSTKSSRPSSRVPDQNIKGWIGAGIAFLATSVGAWFLFKKDD